MVCRLYQRAQCGLVYGLRPAQFDMPHPLSASFQQVGRGAFVLIIREFQDKR